MVALRRILVPTDFSLQARGALQYALVLAHELAARVHVLHVCSDGDVIGRLGALHEATDRAASELEAAARADAEQRMSAFLEQIDGPEAPVDAEVVFDDPYDAIAAQSEKHDLVVMGTHGRRGWQRMLMGSLTQKLLRRLDTPVVTYRWPGEASLPRPGVPKRILVPVDFSDGARSALRLVSHLADHCKAEVDVLHVVQHVPAVEGAELLVVKMEGESKLPFERWTRTRALEEMEVFLSRTRGHERAEVLVELGDPGRTIVRLSEERGYDLIAMGTHGRSGVERFMIGSVAERVAREAPCPVLTVRHEEGATFE